MNIKKKFKLKKNLLINKIKKALNITKMNIGIVTSKQGSVHGITLPYFEYLSYFGDIVLINPLSDQINTTLDLLVLPGGADVYSQRYGEKPSRYCGTPNIDLEWFDVNVLPRYINSTNIPILGICRGAQTLRVHYGGGLSQHIEQETSPNRVELVDTLAVDVTTQLARLIPNNYKVNSLHHQGWYTPTEGFETVAINAHHRNVEIMHNVNRNILAVQYHPEEIYCNVVTAWINSLV